MVSDLTFVASEVYKEFFGNDKTRLGVTLYHATANIKMNLFKCNEFVKFYYAGTGTGYMHLLLFIPFISVADIEFYYTLIKEIIVLRVPEAEERFKVMEKRIFGSNQIPFKTLSLQGRVIHKDENCEAYHKWLNYTYKNCPKPSISTALCDSVGEFHSISRKANLLLDGRIINDRVRVKKMKERRDRARKIIHAMMNARYHLSVKGRSHDEKRFLYLADGIEKIWKIQHKGQHLADPTKKRFKKLD